MKRITRISWAIALVTFLHIPAGHAQTSDAPLITLNVAEAGTLSDMIPQSRRPYVTRLKLTGQLNGTDIRVIREMAGSDENGEATNGALAYLDLSEAVLVSGGVSYYYDDFMGWCTIVNEEGRTSASCLFCNCNKLKNVKLPPIDDMSCAFRGCTSLTSVGVPNGVTILYQAFYGCTSLASVNLPDGVTNLVAAFYDCTSLTSVDVPDSVTDMATAFYGCTSLTSVGVPNGVTILYQAFSGCTSLTSVDLPEGVKDLSYAFGDCTSLTSVDLPEGVKDLSYAFWGCTSLTSVDLPDGVTDLHGTFQFCRSLTSVDVPATVTGLWGTFFNCTQLKSVNILGEEPLDLEDDDMNLTFEGCSSLQYIRFLSPRPLLLTEYPQLNDNVIIYVPKGSYQTYWLTDWGNYHLEEYDLTGIDTLVRPGTVSGQTEYYSTGGKRLSAPQRGVNIIREADGSTRKVLISQP